METSREFDGFDEFFYLILFDGFDEIQILGGPWLERVPTVPFGFIYIYIYIYIYLYNIITLNHRSTRRERNYSYPVFSFLNSETVCIIHCFQPSVCR